MSKHLTLVAFVASLFSRSEKAISEKLSTEEHNEFMADITDLNEKLEASTTENTRIAGELEAAAGNVTRLETELATANTQIATLNTNLTAMTTERDKYKAHYDASAKKGDKEGDDQNSRGASGKAGYNDHAMAVWQKAHA